MIRPDQRSVAELVRAANCRVVEAADAHLGQSRSLAAGVCAMQVYDGLLVGLADMPFVQTDTLRVLASAMAVHPQQVVRPRYDGTTRQPHWLSSPLVRRMTRIEGVQGARHIVAASDHLTWVDVVDPGIHQDIDRRPTSLRPRRNQHLAVFVRCRKRIECAADAFQTHIVRDDGVHRQRAIGNQLKRLRELLSRVAKHVLHVQFLVDGDQRAG